VERADLLWKGETVSTAAVDTRGDHLRTTCGRAWTDDVRYPQPSTDSTGAARPFPPSCPHPSGAPPAVLARPSPCGKPPGARDSCDAHTYPRCPLHYDDYCYLLFLLLSFIWYGRY